MELRYTEKQVIEYFVSYFEKDRPCLEVLYQRGLFSEFTLAQFGLSPKQGERKEENGIRYKENLLIKQIENDKEAHEKVAQVNKLLIDLKPEEVVALLIALVLHEPITFEDKVNIDWLSGKINEFALASEERYLIISSQLLKELPVDFFDFYSEVSILRDWSIEETYFAVKKKLLDSVSPLSEEVKTIQFIKKYMEDNETNYTALLANFDEPVLLIFEEGEKFTISIKTLCKEIKEKQYDYEDVLNVLYQNGVREISSVSLKSIDLEALFKALCIYYTYGEDVTDEVKAYGFVEHSNTLYMTNQDLRETLCEIREHITSEKKDQIAESQGIRTLELEDYYESYKEEPRPNMVVKKYNMKAGK